MYDLDIILQEWSVGLITLPNNFKTILDKTEETKVKRVEMDDNNNTEDGTKIGLEVPKFPTSPPSYVFLMFRWSVSASLGQAHQA